MRRLFVVVAIVLLALAYPAWLGYRIWEQSRHDELRSADAIVVLGAAQYDGRPSPVFRARLLHAAYLYREGFSETVIVAGGKKEGDQFTEAEAGRRYLESTDVPFERIIEVGHGSTTLESLQEVRGHTAGHGIDTVLLVTDPLHSERVKAMAEDLGFEEAYASWTSYRNLQRSRETKVRELLHEIVSLAAYELFGGP